MILFSVFVFKQPLTLIGCIGCIITISGSIWYFYGMYSSEIMINFFIFREVNRSREKLCDSTWGWRRIWCKWKTSASLIFFIIIYFFVYILFWLNSANLVSLYKVCHHKHRNAPLLPIRVVWYFWNLELSTQCISTREDHILIFQNLLYLILINLIIVMELQYDIIKDSIMDSTNNQDFRKRKE